MATRRNSMVRYQMYLFLSMSLCRVHADYQGPNIAKDKCVTGTPVKEGSLSDLVDGNVETCIKSTKTENPYITIDLLYEYKVSSISLIYPKGGDLTNYDDTNVKLEKEEETEDYCSKLNKTSAPSNSLNLTFQCGDHEGQRITVVKLSSGEKERGFGLCEFQVFGESSNIDECETDEHCCNFNFKCHNTIGSYLCLCSDGYREEGGLCVPERTLSERDGTENKIGENGNVTDKVNKIRDISDAVAIIESVAHYWQSNSAVSAGDVVLISEILAKLAEIVASFNESNLNDTEIYIKLFSDEVCRLLTKDREPVWKEIHEKLALDKGVVTLFNALDSIGTTIYDFMIRSGKEVAYSCSVLDINGIFFKEDDNLVVGPSKRDGSTRQRRLVQRNSTATRNSYVYFSKNTLDKLREASLEGKLGNIVDRVLLRHHRRKMTLKAQTAKR
ncbi:uncharacterized protein [Ptychodera flava]|uniref:uncharacterized protein n=1 Tax=Ptychodera flava TaxID=63121 RepID=UPI003969D8B9